MVRSLSVLSRWIPASVAIAEACCAQIAGIQDTNGNARPGNSVAVTRMSVGSKLVPAPLDPGELPATYFIASGAPSGFDRVMATPDPAHGGWTTRLRSAAPVEFTLPDVPTPIPRLFAFPSPQLSVPYSVLEHPSPQAGDPSATFTVTATLDTAVAAGQSFQVYVVGAWLQRGLSAAEAPLMATQLAPPAFAFTAANSISGHAAPDQITTDDAFLILRYTGTALSGVAEAAPFAQQAGMATAVQVETMTPVAPDQMLGVVKIAPPTIAARYARVTPAVAGLQMSWSLVAAPGAALGSNTGPVLQSGGVAMTDSMISASYGNPFVARGWSTIFTLATLESRVYAPLLGPMGMATPITLVAGMNQFFDPAHATDLELPAGLPQAITLGTTVLNSDTVTIKQPTRFVDVSFTVDTPLVAGAAAPSPTLYELDVFDLTVNTAGTALERHLVLAALSDRPAFALPPELFQAGHSYSLRAVADLGGFPGIDRGDFVDRQLPFAQSFLDGGVITVVP